LEFVLSRGAQRRELELRSEACMDRVPACDEYDLATHAHCACLLDAVPDDRGNAAGPIAERQLEILAAVPARSQLDVAHEQRLSDLCAVGEFPDKHGAAKIEWLADGTRTWNPLQSSPVAPVDSV